ncbi:MAG: NTP transferase domain-containing protein, partial [Thiohalophilus sp.]
MSSGIAPEALPHTTGVILAGGLARRMGGHDKGLLEVNGRPMVLHIRDQLKPQVDQLLINANRNQQTYSALTGCPVISDQVGDFAGPLAGMA